MLAAGIYSVRSAAAKNIDGKARTDVARGTIEPPREKRTRKLATANAAVAPRPPLALVRLLILLQRMIRPRRIPTMVNRIRQPASRPLLVLFNLTILLQRMIRHRRIPAMVNRIRQSATRPRQR